MRKNESGNSPLTLTPQTSIDAEGWLHPVTVCPSPNNSARRPGEDINLLVIHNISLPPNEFGGGYVQQFFCNRLPVGDHPYFASIGQLQVSAHCLIDRTGGVTQFVPFSRRAWHAGRSCFEGRPECNDYSIGIELEGADHIPYTEAQYQGLVCVTRLLMAHYPAIVVDRIVGHSDIAPGRKTDPGAAFDWATFRRLLGAA